MIERGRVRQIEREIRRSPHAFRGAIRARPSAGPTRTPRMGSHNAGFRRAPRPPHDRITKSHVAIAVAAQVSRGRRSGRGVEPHRLRHALARPPRRRAGRHARSSCRSPRRPRPRGGELRARLRSGGRRWQLGANATDGRSADGLRRRPSRRGKGEIAVTVATRGFIPRSSGPGRRTVIDCKSLLPRAPQQRTSPPAPTMQDPALDSAASKARDLLRPHEGELERAPRWTDEVSVPEGELACEAQLA